MGLLEEASHRVLIIMSTLYALMNVCLVSNFSNLFGMFVVFDVYILESCLLSPADNAIHKHILSFVYLIYDTTCVSLSVTYSRAFCSFNFISNFLLTERQTLTSVFSVAFLFLFIFIYYIIFGLLNQPRGVTHVFSNLL